MIDKTSRASEQTAIRLAPDMRQRLAESAAENNRTVSEEIRVRLGASLAGRGPLAITDPWLGTVTAGISFAAAGASATLAAQGTRDPAVYAAFEFVVTAMLEANRPEGASEVSKDAKVRAALLLLGTVFGQMGQSVPQSIAGVLTKIQEEADAR